ELTRGLKGLAVSKLASRLRFASPSEKALLKKPGKVAEPSSENSAPPPAPAPSPNVVIEEQEDGSIATTLLPELETLVVHLGDSEGAVLADFEYGKGRVIFLSDPFVIANNGIAQGSNLRLAMNLISALSRTGDGKSRKIFFDEYNHGYESQSSSVIAYFRGTPMFWLIGQLLLVAALIAYSYGRRFARPLPMPQVDRHSPLEFVGSMANLQQVAQARDLALENIYPRFRTKVCRSLGLPVSASPREIAARLKMRMKADLSEAELQRIFTESERVLNGGTIDDHHLVDLVAAMRRISSRIAN
ncbi:MAG TPA: DUF4350 domain-containing protein, partial [Blastocatellia bacterium]|nr:DUF4350 domain-containing protein [Blastocatellia bacterium]